MKLIFHNREFGEHWDASSGHRSTVVLEKPDVREIMQELRKQFILSCMKIPKITVNIGVARVHPKDSFNKKLGRRLAESRMRPVEMTIGIHDMYQNSDEAVWLVLNGVDPENQIHYSLNVKVYRDSGNMRALACYTRVWQ